MESSICELCDRLVPYTTEHHLVPRSYGKRKGKRPEELPTAALCAACHRQIHVLFENTILAKELATVEALKQHAAMQRFLEWVRKQNPHRRIRVRRGA